MNTFLLCFFVCIDRKSLYKLPPPRVRAHLFTHTHTYTNTHAHTHTHILHFCCKIINTLILKKSAHTHTYTHEERTDRRMQAQTHANENNSFPAFARELQIRVLVPAQHGCLYKISVLTGVIHVIYPQQWLLISSSESRLTDFLTLSLPGKIFTFVGVFTKI
jgi:hypothetical protein